MNEYYENYGSDYENYGSDDDDYDYDNKYNVVEDSYTSKKDKIVEDKDEEFDKDNINEALIEACKNQKLKMVKRLIEAGADVNFVDDRSMSALDIMCDDDGYSGEIIEKIVEVLIEAGADIEHIYDHKTPLYRACDIGNGETAKLLIKAGANVNAITDMGETPLMAATLSCGADVIELLFDAGADFHAKSYSTYEDDDERAGEGVVGLTAFQIAEKQGKGNWFVNIYNRKILEKQEKNLKILNSIIKQKENGEIGNLLKNLDDPNIINEILNMINDGKRKSTKRKSTKRRSVKRKSVKRKSVKRKSVKRKSVKRKSVKRNH